MVMGPGSRPGRQAYLTRLSALIQSPHHLVQLIEVAIANVDGAAGVAVIDIDRKSQRVADALFQRDRVGILGLAATRLLRLGFRHALAMRPRLGLASVQ